VITENEEGCVVEDRVLLELLKQKLEVSIVVGKHSHRSIVGSIDVRYAEVKIPSLLVVVVEIQQVLEGKVVFFDSSETPSTSS
jgi:hypothetical protein